MSDWPKYESHKIVQAAKIVGFNVYPGGGSARSAAIVDPGSGETTFAPNEHVMLEKANVGDWAIIYEDGYASISPAKAFEDGYTPCP